MFQMHLLPQSLGQQVHVKPLCKFIILYSVTSLNTAVFLVFTTETSNLVCDSLCSFCLYVVSCSDR